MMNKQIALFLGLCIPSRLLIAWASSRVPRGYMPYFATCLLLVALAFLFLFFSDSRLNAPEAGGETWWAAYRLIIGLLWLAAAIYAFQGKTSMVWIPLVIDILLGMVIFYVRHYT